MKTNNLLFCLAILLLLSTCTTDEDLGPCPACPSITSINPNHGRGGDEVTITGTNFEDFIVGEDRVTINSQDALVSNVLPTTLQVKVPEQAGSGTVVVKIGTLSSTEVSDTIFFTYDEVRVDSISPPKAKMGEIITIHGAFFDESVPGNNVVIFPNDSVAEVTEATEMYLKVRVPKSAGSGPISVKVDGISVNGPVFQYELTTTVSTFAGIGAAASLKSPNALAIDKSDNLLVIVDDGIKRITPDKTVTTITVRKLNHDTPFSTMIDIEVGADDLVYIADVRGNNICVVTPNRDLQPFAGSGKPGLKDGNRLQAQFITPLGVTFNAQQDIYVADAGNAKIRRISNGLVTTVNFSTTELIKDLIFDQEGNLIILMSTRIYKMQPNGSVSLIAGAERGYSNGQGAGAKFAFLSGITIDSQGNFYVTDTSNQRIRKITPSGIVTTIAGAGESDYKDGIGEDARFNSPQKVVIDSHGNLYVTDTGNHVIRKISLE